MKRTIVILLALVLLVSAAAAFGESSKRELPTLTLTFNETKVTAELARSDSDRRHGLMGRTSLPKNHGMLFLFDREQTASFWMKNTKMALDIAFIDSRGVLFQVLRMEVPKPGAPLKHYNSAKPAKYALEMKAGWFAKHKITAGYVVPELAVKK